MTEAKLTWSIWQALLNAFAWAFTRRGFRRFAGWIIAMAINVGERTIAHSALAPNRPADWEAVKSFAEYGPWSTDYVTRGLTRLDEKAPRGTWHGSRRAVDDTKVHRGAPHVWGTCTFREYTARCSKRAATVRAHDDGVALGALLHNPVKRAWYPPISGRLYYRKSQMPPRSGMAGPTSNSAPSASWPSG